MQVRIPAAFLVCSADLLTAVSRPAEPSGNFPEAVSLNSIFYLFEPDQTSSFTYAVIFFSLRSRILRLTEPYPSVNGAVSFSLHSRILQNTQSSRFVHSAVCFSSYRAPCWLLLYPEYCSGPGTLGPFVCS